jgi:hypothetical protein
MWLAETRVKPHEQDGHRKSIATDLRVRQVAPEGSIRLKTFYKFLPSISAFFRRRRMRKFAEIVRIRAGTRVLDLGGAPAIWEHVSVPLEITLLNLAPSLRRRRQARMLGWDDQAPYRVDAKVSASGQALVTASPPRRRWIRWIRCLYPEELH